MRILFILDEFLPENSGGAANVAFGLAKSLINLGHEVFVLTATNDSEKEDRTEIEGIQVRIIFTRHFGYFRNFRNLKNRSILKKAEKFFIEQKPDIIHIHTLHHRFSYGIISLAKKYAPVFLTLHDSQAVYNGKLYPKRKICNLNLKYDYKINWFDRFKKDGLSYNPFQRMLIKMALKKVNKIFAVSNALREAIMANGVSNIEMIHNGIDAEEWEVKEAGENIILFAGRVDEAKGINVLIKAFELVKSEISNVKLAIVGDGEFKTEQSTNIKILPWQGRGEMKKIFSEAAVIVVPSLYLDPFPTVNLEAMAAGKPVVGTCFGGTPEVVVNNETGYIVNPYNEKELAKKVIDLLKNPEKALAFGKAGRKRVEKEFSLERQVQKTLEWYNKFIRE